MRKSWRSGGRKAEALDYDLIEGVDTLDVAEVTAQNIAVVVGAFMLFLRALRSLGARHWVQKDLSTLKPV